MSSGRRVLENIDSKLEIILASSSPRRYEILSDVMGIKDLKVMKPSFEENLDKSKYKNNPIDYVSDTSRCKAEGIAEDLKVLTKGQQPKVILVVCADTVVIDEDNVIYEKPKNKDIQLINLKNFCYNGRVAPLRVVTAVTIIRWTNEKDFEIREPFHEITRLFCDDEIPLELLEEYVESEDGLNVAGGFKIQGMSGMLIKKIDGDYYNVVGLPLNRTFQAIYKESLL